MNIIGNKVVLRAIEPGDKDLFLEIINDPETEKMIGGLSFPVSSLEQEQWIKNQVGNKAILRCVIAKREEPEKGIGTIILSDIDYKNGVAQVHIKLSPIKARGQGLGTDALMTISDYAFDELRLNSLYADVLAYNVISHKLFLKCGFKRDGVLRQRVFKDGNYIDVYSYSLVRADKKHV